MSSIPDRVQRRVRREVENRRRARHDRRVDARAAQMPKPPAPPPVSTNIGPEMDALVNRARANELPPGLDPDYDLLREHFDHTHFLLQAQLLHDAPQADPIRFFLRNGADATNSPDVHFSMRNYLELHPEVLESPERSPYLHWLKHGRAEGQIADPGLGINDLAPVLGLTPAQVVDELVAVRSDYNERMRTGTLGKMFAKATEIEPLIGGAWPEVARTRLVPLGAKIIARQIAAVYESQRQAKFRRARLVIVTNRPRWGAGRRFEGHLAHALGGTVAPEDIVVIYTDEGGKAPRGRFPRGVRQVDFATPALGLFDDARQRALVALLRSFQAEAIININSAALYRALIPFGRALAASERIYLAMFCNEQTAMGTWEGWSQGFFYPLFPIVEGVLTDSEFLRDQLEQRYQIDTPDLERVHVFAAPVQPEIPVAALPTAAGGRRTVFWAGRWDRQKRVDIALAVAERMPDVDFRLWGEPVLGGDPLSTVPANVQLLPAYTSLDQVDFENADAWLYTSAWDGVPSLLLEVAMTGVPIVASSVGGVPEVIGADVGWPVADWREPDAYVTALRDVLADPRAARAKALTLRERLLEERSQTVYAEHAAGILGLKAQPGAGGETGDLSDADEQQEDLR